MPVRLMAMNQRVPDPTRRNDFRSPNNESIRQNLSDLNFIYRTVKRCQGTHRTYDLVLIVSQANAFLVRDHCVEGVIGVIDDVLCPRQ